MKPYKITLKRYMEDPAKAFRAAGDRKIDIIDLNGSRGPLAYVSVFAVLLLVGVAYVLWSVLPVKVITVSQAHVVNSSVRAGEAVIVQYSYCKHQPFQAVAADVEVSTGGRLFRAEPNPLPPQNKSAPVGCASTTIEAFKLPLATPIEAYSLPARAKLTYEFKSGLRTVRESYWTDTFIILPPLVPPPAVLPLVQSLEAAGD